VHGREVFLQQRLTFHDGNGAGSGPCRVVGLRKGGKSMSRRFLGVVGVLTVLFGALAGVVLAQEGQRMNFETSFAFLLNDKEMPAGQYQLEALQGQGPSVLTLRNLQTNDKTIVKAITRLADLGGSEPQVVFDKTANAYYLAEAHFPGIDGFDLQHAPGEHSHTRVPAKQ
jgi:hypothetical protein